MLLLLNQLSNVKRSTGRGAAELWRNIEYCWYVLHQRISVNLHKGLNGNWIYSSNCFCSYRTECIGIFMTIRCMLECET